MEDINLTFGHRITLRLIARGDDLKDLATDARLVPLIGAGLVAVQGSTYSLTSDGRSYLERWDAAAKDRNSKRGQA